MAHRSGISRRSDFDDLVDAIVKASGTGSRTARKVAAKAITVLRDADRILVFTGAGVSTESGIPDFRGPQGLWQRTDPADFSFGAFVGSPVVRSRVWAMIQRERLVGEVVHPNPAHFAVVDLWQGGRLAGCVTQNVDGLHQAAGLPEEMVAELHGTGATATCVGCTAIEPMTTILERVDAGDPDPACKECGGVLKPSMVMFGELLPPEPMRRAALWAHGADAVLAIGSTLSIYPAASVVAKTARRGKPLVIVNLGETEHDDLARVKLDGPAGTVLPLLVTAILERGT